MPDAAAWWGRSQAPMLPGTTDGLSDSYFYLHTRSLTLAHTLLYCHGSL